MLVRLILNLLYSVLGKRSERYSESPCPQSKRSHLCHNNDQSSSASDHQHKRTSQQYSNYDIPRAKRRCHREQQCSSGINLHHLAHISPSEAIHELHSHFKEFEQIISSFRHDDQTIVNIVKVLSHIIKANKKHKHHGKLNEILDVLLSNVTLEGFFFPLTLFIRRIPMIGDARERMEFPSVMQGIIKLFTVLLDLDPVTATKHLPIDVCVGTTQQLLLLNQAYCYQDINEEAQQLLKKRNEICAAIYKSRMKVSQPSKVSIALPDPEELHHKPEIRENIVDKPFTSVEDYLKIQRDLLRQDFINPLRSALSELDDDSTEKFTGVKFKKGKTFTSSGVAAYKLSFKTSRKIINWSFNKVLMDGSLVCLSEDNFSTVLYATVTARDVKELNKGILTVQLQGHDGHLLPKSQDFTMIESPGYFEAYAPVIRKLHKIIPESLPFSQYIVQLQDTFDIPKYLRHNKRAVFNLKGVVCDCGEECTHRQIDVLDHQSWQELHLPKFDTSQKNALHLALTHELALIQGPPGTGKTFIGLKVIQALLQNSHIWKNTCLLYTSDAADE